MSVLIIGGNGNMGKRYSAVLRHLGVPFRVVDKDDSRQEIRKKALESSGVIIVTPTDLHCSYIKLCSDLKVPILCEKPISKDLVELKETLEQCKKEGTNLTMVYQYKMLAPSDSTGPSHYNYFRHGNDGLYWDCIQIIGLAKGSVSITESSPYWDCSINGKALDLGEMDWAYIEFIRRWLNLPGDDFDEIYRVHEKTHEMEKSKC